MASAGALAFEGSEKRLEVTCALGANAPAQGLRHLGRAQLDELLDQARTVLSSCRPAASSCSAQLVACVSSAGC